MSEVTKTELNQRYADLCATLGDAVVRRDKAAEVVAQVKARIDELNAKAAQLSAPVAEATEQPDGADDIGSDGVTADGRD